MDASVARISPPLPLYTRDPFASNSSRGSSDSCTDPSRTIVFEELGYTFSGTTCESRHDCRLSRTSIAQARFLHDDVFPPSYFESTRDVLPQYSTQCEPITLARYLFRLGFLFPPFWVIGACILLSPLRVPSSAADQESGVGVWLPEKTEAEKQAFIAHLRKAELKWAKRCLVALAILACVAGITAGLAVWVRR
ncbi:hypothetical protein D9756_010379 [Leucocoprinus leucothites]|uniref:Uncharacterized protein n=1 Tax=Leucocoprinus leucothites TaxID=201217 RepID=A0A8H5FS55_9AGAR|nr:hypothetical protein D9756_010379 [Leucoagaricus leucothites]